MPDWLLGIMAIKNYKSNFGFYMKAAIITAAAGVIALGAYARIWEYGQPKQAIENAKVLSVESYANHSDLHWTSRGYRIRIEGESRVIDFPLKNWDDTVREGDSIDVVVRASFPFGNELDGIKMDDHK